MLVCSSLNQGSLTQQQSGYRCGGVNTGRSTLDDVTWSDRGVDGTDRDVRASFERRSNSTSYVECNLHRFHFKHITSTTTQIYLLRSQQASPSSYLVFRWRHLSSLYVLDVILLAFSSEIMHSATSRIRWLITTGPVRYSDSPLLQQSIRLSFYG